MKGRPPTKRTQPSLSQFDVLRDPDFLDAVKDNLLRKETAARDDVQRMAAGVEKDPDAAKRRTGVDYRGELGDVLRSVVYEQSHPAFPTQYVQVDKRGDHIGYRVMDIKTSDCPLNYLHQRVEKKNRITDIQYAAGIRYREDVMSLARVGSNTAATIEHLIMAPDLTPEDRWMKLNGIETMKGGNDVVSLRDPTSNILASVYRVRRIEDRLEVWERELLRELVVIERTVGMIAGRWGIQPEAASTLVRMALWKLARIMESSDREFQSWLVMERQISGEAK